MLLKRFSYSSFLTLIALVVLPVAVLLVASFRLPVSSDWSLVDWYTTVVQTMALAAAVVLLAGSLGVGLAYLVSCFEFRGRTWLGWLLVMPLAVPTYVMAFVQLSIWDDAGVAGAMWLQIFGVSLQFRSFGGLVIVTALSLFPYIFLLASQAFAQQHHQLIASARSLGLSSSSLLWRLRLPMAAGHIKAALLLVVMEVLADFGAPVLFNIETMTVAIYDVGMSGFDWGMAARLSVVLLSLIAIISIWLRQSASLTGDAHQTVERYRLTGAAAIFFPALAWVVVGLAFFIPVMKLLYWCMQVPPKTVIAPLIASATLAGLGALLVVFVMACTLSARRYFQQHWISGLSDMGYAFPGTVLAMALVVGFVWLERVLDVSGLLVGGVLGLLLAYLIRFYAIAIRPAASRLACLTQNLKNVSRSLGTSRWHYLKRVEAPILLPGFMLAFCLVAIEILKEMPATLILRPFGWDTLAVKVFELTSEGEWELAAWPALMVVIASLIPVWFYARHR